MKQIWFLVGFEVVLICFSQSLPARPQRGETDHLSAPLRERVEKIKAEYSVQPTNGENLTERGEVLWDWLNAYSLTGGAIPVSAPAIFPAVFRTADRRSQGDDYEPPGLASLCEAIDTYIYEFSVKDDYPDAPGLVTLVDNGPFPASSWQTIEQTLKIGEKPMVVGGGVLLAKQLLWDGGWPQHEAPSGDHFASLECSNPDVVFERAAFPLSGMHGSLRGPEFTPMFRLARGTLEPGDTVTIIYGDRSRGSRGLLMQSFQTDAALFPLYVDLDGEGKFLTPKWPVFAIEGNEVESVRGIVPSIVEPGERFNLILRSEDGLLNRATGEIPAYEASLDGEDYGNTPAGHDAICSLKDLRLPTEGVYRFKIRSKDGTITSLSNPVWVRKDPAHRIYWGETHAHTGMAEGQGTIDTLYRYARDEAQLDFLGFSEHDLLLDALEWRRMRDAVSRYTEEGRFIAYFGYEWTMPRGVGGHHNVFFRSPTLSPAPGQQSYDLGRLYQSLRSWNDPKDVLIIPHAHQAGDWTQNDSEMETLVEIMSQHGTFEWFGNYYLRNGFQIGFVAASDNHSAMPGYTGTNGRGKLLQFGGLAGVMAPEKTTRAIFDGMKNRSVYAVTSAERIILDVTVNKTPMGQVAPASQRRVLECRVMGTAPIEATSVVKNGRMIFAKRWIKMSIRSECLAQISFESSSEPFIRDNPRGQRRWKGTLSVIGAKLKGLDRHFDNRHLDSAGIDPADPNHVIFRTDTRGWSDRLTLQLDGVSAATEILISLEETTEHSASPVLVRPNASLAAREIRLKFSRLRDGLLAERLEEGSHTDSIRLQLIDPDALMDRQLRYVDSEGGESGDYYYIRVDQTNGARAWSSPIWVGRKQ